jgi:hypothetical protein
MLHPSYKVFALIMVLFPATSAIAANQRLSTLISKVAAQEQRYRNLEFHRHWKYQLKLPESLLKQRKDTNLFRELQRDSRHVYQDGRFTIQEQISGVSLTGVKSSHTIRIGYDGQQTRLVEDGVVRFEQGKDLNYPLRKPHVFLLDRLAEEPSLAELLTSPTARGYFLSVTYEAEENVKGLNCHRIRIATWVKGQQRHDFSRLWLAPERNWIPIREEGYALGYSDSIPLQISEVTAWHQPAPGIWFPHQIRDITHDEQSAANGKTVISNQSETTLTRISFSPHYDLKYFQDAPLPTEQPTSRPPKQPAE